MTEQAWSQKEQKLLSITSATDLAERFQTTSLPLTRRIALLARIDEKAARAYAAKLDADQAVIEAGISLWRTIDKAMQIEKILEKDRAELDRDLETAKIEADQEIRLRRLKGDQEIERLGKQHELDIAELDARLGALQRQQAAPAKRKNPVDLFKERLRTIQGGDAASKARAEAAERKKAIDEDPLVEDKEHAKGQVDDELERFLEWLRRRG